MISVIIPTYNEEKHLGILLTSLAMQDCAREIEVVVADAFSTDETREVAYSFGRHFKNLLVVDGGMPAPGRNRGAEASSGDLLFFIDADIYIADTEFLSKSEKYFRGHNLGISTVYLDPLGDNFFDKCLIGFYDFCLYMSRFFRALGAMCIIADREVWKKVGGYPEDVIMNEDHDFMLSASHVGKYAVTPYRVAFDVRRMEKEGRWNLLWKYAQATVYNVTRGPIRKPIFKYDFGYDNNDKK